MHEILKAFICFVLPVILFQQMRFLIKLKKRNFFKINGMLFSLETMEDCCCYCFARSCCDIHPSHIRSSKEIREDTGTIEERAPYEHEIKEALEEGKGRKTTYLSEEAERKKIIDLIGSKKKVSLMYLCNRSSLTKQRVIEIVLQETSLRLNGEYFINVGEFTEEDSLELRMEQEVKGRKEKIAKGLCPECKNPIEIGTRFCISCGFDLEKYYISKKS